MVNLEEAPGEVNLGGGGGTSLQFRDYLNNNNSIEDSVFSKENLEEALFRKALIKPEERSSQKLDYGTNLFDITAAVDSTSFLRRNRRGERHDIHDGDKTPVSPSPSPPSPKGSELVESVTPDKSNGEKSRVPWNLAGLVGHIPPDPGTLPHPPPPLPPHYSHYPPTSGGGHPGNYDPSRPGHHFVHPGGGEDTSTAPQSSASWAPGGMTAASPSSSSSNLGNPTAAATTTTTVNANMQNTENEPTGRTGNSSSSEVPYKMDPEPDSNSLMSSMYYPHHVPISGSSEVPTQSSVPPTSAAPSTSADQLSGAQGFQPNLEHQDVMQTLHQYFGASELPIGGDESGGAWIDPNQVGHPAVLADPYHEYGLAIRAGNSYGDRKKKIIKEWTKSHTSGSDQEASSRAAAAAAAAAAAGYIGAPPTGAEFLPPYYSSHIKDEPALRAAAEYQQHYQQYYQEASLSNPYMAQMAGGGNNGMTDPLGTLHHHHHHHSHHNNPQQQQQHQISQQQQPQQQQHQQQQPQPTQPRRKERKKKANQHQQQQQQQQNNHPGLSGMSRDERKALTLGLPIPVLDIINLPMDEFNDLLSKHELTEEQLSLCRDIRRRGKNKVAARNCRKRKIDQIKQLEDDVTRIRCRKTELVQEHEKLSSQRSHWTDAVKRLHDYVLKELGHDPLHWELQMDHNRQVHILPRSQDPGDPSKLRRPYHYAPSLGPPVMEGGTSGHLPR